MSHSRHQSEHESRSRDTRSPPRGRSSQERDYPRRPRSHTYDSYYNPRDKYYLSGDEDDLNTDYRAALSRDRGRDRDSFHHSGTRSRPSSADHHYDSHRRGSSTTSSSHARSSSGHTRSDDRHYRYDDAERGRRYPPSASRHRDTIYHDHHSSSRAGSSSRARSSGGSSTSRHRGHSKNINAEREPSKEKSNGLVSQAVRVALEAGAMAALKQRNDPTPWIGMKGTKVAAAAIGAAAIDTFMERKAPKRKGGLSHTVMRQATTMALGNLVLKPAAKGTPMGRTSR